MFIDDTRDKGCWYYIYKRFIAATQIYYTQFLMPSSKRSTNIKKIIIIIIIK